MLKVILAECRAGGFQQLHGNGQAGATEFPNRGFREGPRCGACLWERRGLSPRVLVWSSKVWVSSWPGIPREISKTGIQLTL